MEETLGWPARAESSVERQMWKEEGFLKCRHGCTCRILVLAGVFQCRSYHQHSRSLLSACFFNVQPRNVETLPWR